jgi:hypothetical protein
MSVVGLDRFLDRAVEYKYKLHDKHSSLAIGRIIGVSDSGGFAIMDFETGKIFSANTNYTHVAFVLEQNGKISARNNRIEMHINEDDMLHRLDGPALIVRDWTNRDRDTAFYFMGIKMKSVEEIFEAAKGTKYEMDAVYSLGNNSKEDDE